MSGRNTDSPTTPSEHYARILSLAVHELRTPASVVGGYLAMLERDTAGGLGEPQRRMVKEAEKALGHIVGLIGQASELAALMARTEVAVREPLDLFQILAKAAAEVHEAEDRGVRLRIDGAAAGAGLVGDPARWRAAMTAILRTVLREQPVATLVVADRRRASVEGHDAAVVVVAREVDLERAADVGPASPAFDELRGGLGLTLPIARVMVERHGGRLWSPLAGDADPAARGAIVLSVPVESPR